MVKCSSHVSLQCRSAKCETKWYDDGLKDEEHCYARPGREALQIYTIPGSSQKSVPHQPLKAFESKGVSPSTSNNRGLLFYNSFLVSFRIVCVASRLHSPIVRWIYISLDPFRTHLNPVWENFGNCNKISSADHGDGGSVDCCYLSLAYRSIVDLSTCQS